MRMRDFFLAVPYAGLNRVRFEGFDLRPLRPPPGVLLRSDGIRLGGAQLRLNFAVTVFTPGTRLTRTVFPLEPASSRSLAICIEENGMNS